MKTTVKINSASKVIKDHGLDKSGKAQKFHTQNVLRRIQKYMPYRTGSFIKLTIAQTDINKPEIVSNAPQAKYLFYGYAMEGRAPKRVTSRGLNYTKTKNPKAGPRWDKSLVASEKAALVSDLKAYIRRG